MTDPTTVQAPVHRTESHGPPFRVLLSAFGCIAGHGGEPGTGWGWARALAEAGHEVTVLTHPKGRAENDAWLKAHRSLDLRIEYVESGVWTPAARFISRAGKEWWDSKGWQLPYLAWQQAALGRAAKLHQSECFDVAHHVSYCTFVTGSPLWRLGIPFVFGPVGGAQRSPRGAALLYGQEWRVERLRSFVVSMTRVNPFARRAVHNAAVVLTTNGDTASMVSSIGARRLEMMCGAGIDPDAVGQGRPPPGSAAEREPSGRARVIWVGRLNTWKGPGLAIDAFASTTRRVDAELHIAGTGPMASHVRDRVAAHDLQDRVLLHGNVPWDEVQALLASSDVMLFTSLRDTFATQIVEGAFAGLPLVSLDLHGVASLVPNDAAIKVPFTTLHEAVSGLGEALTSVLSDRERRSTMSRAARRFGEDQTWPRRAEHMTAIYRDVLNA
jgi:glycosyltransferase involved in cell wall biosynthesis